MVLPSSFGALLARLAADRSFHSNVQVSFSCAAVNVRKVNPLSKAISVKECRCISDATGVVRATRERNRHQYRDREECC